MNTPHTAARHLGLFALTLTIALAQLAAPVAAQTWVERTPPGQLPPRQNNSGATFDAARGVVVTVTRELGVNATWEWDGSFWRSVAESRRAYDVVFDPRCGCSLTFTTVTACAGIQVSRWDGSTWNDSCDTDAPGQPNASVWDSTAERVLALVSGPTAATYSRSGRTTRRGAGSSSTTDSSPRQGGAQVPP